MQAGFLHSAVGTKYFLYRRAVESTKQNPAFRINSCLYQQSFITICSKLEDTLRIKAFSKNKNIWFHCFVILNALQFHVGFTYNLKYPPLIPRVKREPVQSLLTTPVQCCQGKGNTDLSNTVTL